MRYLLNEIKVTRPPATLSFTTRGAGMGVIVPLKALKARRHQKLTTSRHPPAHVSELVTPFRRTFS
ncbi:MAG: hypothetical protein QOH31_1152 [Verrucomicrobiota bacterium]